MCLFPSVFGYHNWFPLFFKVQPAPIGDSERNCHLLPPYTNCLATRQVYQRVFRLAAVPATTFNNHLPFHSMMKKSRVKEVPLNYPHLLYQRRCQISTHQNHQTLIRTMHTPCCTCIYSPILPIYPSLPQ